MIHLKLFSAYKSKKKELEQRRIEQEKELALQEQKLELQKQNYIRDLEIKINEEKRIAERELLDLKDLMKRNLDKKEELAKANEDLRQQIRLIEAKARPDELWVQAFTSGFQKAWEVMSPLMNEGIRKAQGRIKTVAIEETLRRLRNGNSLQEKYK